MKIISLVRTSAEDKLQTKGGPAKDEQSDYYLRFQNIPFSAFMQKLQSFFVKEGALPVIDKTDYKARIDIEINAELKDISALNEELKKYDLKLEDNEELVDMIIISKTPTP